MADAGPEARLGSKQSSRLGSKQRRRPSDSQGSAGSTPCTSNRYCSAARDARRQQREAEIVELTRSLNKTISSIGVGPYQLVLLACGGGVYLAEGCLLLMLSIIGKGLIEKWELSPLVAGAMATVIFVGLLAGTISGGLACDSYGRRMPILTTYLGIGAFLLIIISAPSVTLLLVAKFMLGFFLGFGVPAGNALVTESSPKSQRSNIYCLTMVLFSVGQVYAATIVWLINPDISHAKLQWRGMLGMAALMPLVLLVLAYFFLLESPHWLVVNGRIADAQAVVAAMLQYKRAEGTARQSAREILSWADRIGVDEEQQETESDDVTESVQESIQEMQESDLQEQHHESPATTSYSSNIRFDTFMTPEARRRLRATRHSLQADYWRLSMLFSPTFRTTTLIMLFVSFCSNFAYYGMIYGLPDTLKKAHVQSSDEDGNTPSSPAAVIFLSAMFEIPGVFVAIVLGMTVGRRSNMSFDFFCCGGLLILICYALSTGQIMANIGIAAVLCMKLFLAAGYIVVYLYLLECYPTKFRATGLAFSMVLGRMGAFCCPVLYDGLHWLGVEPWWFFAAISSLMFLASVACCLLPFETKDMELEGDAPPGSSRTPLNSPTKVPTDDLDS